MAKVLKQWMAAEYSKMLDVDSFIIFGYEKMDVEQVQILRNLLIQKKIRIKVLNNKIAGVALQKMHHKDFSHLLKGPSAIVYGGDSPVEIAKVLLDWNKKAKLIKIHGGFLSGQILSAGNAEGLSKIPSKEVLLSQLAGAFQGMAQQIATVLGAALQNVSNALGALVEKQEQNQ